MYFKPSQCHLAQKAVDEKRLKCYKFTENIELPCFVNLRQSLWYRCRWVFWTFFNVSSIFRDINSNWRKLSQSTNSSIYLAKNFLFNNKSLKQSCEKSKTSVLHAMNYKWSNSYSKLKNFQFPSAIIAWFINTIAT